MHTQFADKTTVEQFWDDQFKNTKVIPKSEDPVLKNAIDFFGDIRGSRLLELGCGDGRMTSFFAQKGAEVTTIDISANSVLSMQNFCQRNQISNIKAIHCSAFEIAELDQFDFIFGSMILHHLEPFQKFAEVLNLSLKSNGKAFFYENNATDLLLWCRKNLVGKFGIPRYGDNEESPLDKSELQCLRGYFKVDIIYPKLYLFELLSTYLLKDEFKELMVILDEFFYKFPQFRQYSYRQYLYLSKSN